MKRFTILFSIILLFVCAATMIAQTLPAGVLTYVPIILTNNQSSTTPTNFQQQLTVDWSSYSSYLNSGVTNVEFFDASGTILKAWCESGNTSSNAASVVWVNLGTNVVPAAGGTLTIYMGFLSTGTNNMGNSDASVWGEAPSLSGTYGQYDNGANVFAFYDNFTGTNLSSKWTKTATSGAFTVNNGVTLPKNTSTADYPSIVTSSYTQGQGIMDFNGTIKSGSETQYAYWNMYVGVIPNDGTGGNMAAIVASNSTNYSHTVAGLYTSTTNSGTSYYATTLSSGSSAIYSLIIPSSSPSSISAQVNYGGTITSSTYIPTLPGPLGLENQTNSAGNLFVQWIRTRAYPPNSTMPTASFGGQLPVELTSFTANTSNGIIQLKWTTATEVNNYGFSVERSEASLNNPESGASSYIWETIGFVQGHGNSNSPKEYSFTDDLNLAFTPNLNYLHYRLKQIDNDGQYKYSDVIEISNIAPSKFQLFQNYPNPFNPSTTICYSIPQKSKVALKVFDVLGTEVTTLVNEEKEAGVYTAEFNNAGLSSGVYFYSLTADKYSSIKKFVLLK